MTSPDWEEEGRMPNLAAPVPSPAIYVAAFYKKYKRRRKFRQKEMRRAIWVGFAETQNVNNSSTRKNLPAPREGLYISG